MGYRSSVYIQIPNDCLEEFWGLINTGLENIVDEDEEGREETIADMIQDVKNFLNSIEQKHITEAKVYFSDSIKWYTSDDGALQVIENSVKELSAGYFLRTGEDDDDIDYHDSACEPVYSIYRRSVTCVGTEDAVENGLRFFDGIEQAPQSIRHLAITKLRGVLARLMEAEGLSPLPETTDFEE